MPNTTKLIQLSAEDLLTLIKERSIQRDGVVITSNSSFLSIVALLEDELSSRLSHVRSKPA